ncbi:hypothetical protein YC2023_073801 [Brassica napus]
MRSEAWSRRRLSERRGRGGETHREGFHFQHEAFSPDAMEEDASAAVGDSGELRQEEIQRWWVWIGGMTIIAVEILPSVYCLSVAYINTHDLVRTNPNIKFGDAPVSTRFTEHTVFVGLAETREPIHGKAGCSSTLLLVLIQIHRTFRSDIKTERHHWLAEYHEWKKERFKRYQ